MCTINEYMHRLIANPHLDYHLWYLATNSPGTISNTEQHLMATQSSLFPSLDKGRHIYAFRNGVLHIRWAEQPFLYKWPIRENDPWWEVKWFNYGSTDTALLPANTVATKYFDEDLPLPLLDMQEWREIPTPALHSILAFQGL